MVAFTVWRISTLFIGEEAAGPTAEEILLSEIRDQLRASNRCGQAPAARG